MWNKIKDFGFQRIFRIVMAVLVAVYAIDSENYAILLVSAVFLLQAIFNVSCCGPAGCSTSPRATPKEPKEVDDTVEFEEIK